MKPSSLVLSAFALTALLSACGKEAPKTEVSAAPVAVTTPAPAAPVAKLQDLPLDPHLVATAFFETLSDPTMGEVRFPGVPVRFDGQRPPITMPPRLGQHTQELLAQAGLSAAQIEALLDTRAAIAPNP